MRLFERTQNAGVILAVAARNCIVADASNALSGFGPGSAFPFAHHLVTAARGKEQHDLRSISDRNIGDP